MRKMIFILILLGISMSVFSFGKKDEVVFREVALQVVDAETGLPVPELVVYNSLVIYRPKGLYIFGQLIGEAKDEQICFIEQYKTDQNGKLIIPENRISVDSDQYLHRQSIYINIDFIDPNLSVDEKLSKFRSLINPDYANHSSHTYSPKKEYKIVNILSKPYPMGDRYNQLEGTKSFLQQINNEHEVPELDNQQRKREPKSFFCGRENFFIKLEKRNEIK